MRTLLPLGALAAIAIVAAPAADARTLHCPNAPDYSQAGPAHQVRATNATCRAARAVIRQWQRTAQPEQECDTRAEGCTVFTYSCQMSDSGFANIRVSCRHGARRISFLAVLSG